MLTQALCVHFCTRNLALVHSLWLSEIALPLIANNISMRFELQAAANM